MFEASLIPDKVYLQEVTKVEDRPAGDINCTDRDLESKSEARAINYTEIDAVRDLIDHSVADATRVALESDLRHFATWGGTLPATPAMIAAYIAAYAGSLAVATITRRVASLSKVHRTCGEGNPCRSPLVEATMAGLRRKHGTAPKQAKALEVGDLFVALDATGSSVRDVRDRALLLVGFAAALRRSELVGLDAADIERVRQGLIVTLRRSKTDQEGTGRKIGIPFGRTRWCPVFAVMHWLDITGITEGSVFRPVDRHGNIGAGRLSGEAVGSIVRERVAAAGIDPIGYSGHSLRAGFATSAAQAGVSTFKIRAQTGHASEAMLHRYIRNGELFVGNAAGRVL